MRTYIQPGEGHVFLKNTKTKETLTVFLAGQINIQVADPDYGDSYGDLTAPVPQQSTFILTSPIANSQPGPGLHEVLRLVERFDSEEHLSKDDFESRDDLRLALAVLKGDRQAALVLADHVLETYHGSKKS